MTSNLPKSSSSIFKHSHGRCFHFKAYSFRPAFYTEALTGLLLIASALSFLTFLCMFFNFYFYFFIFFSFIRRVFTLEERAPLGVILCGLCCPPCHCDGPVSC